MQHIVATIAFERVAARAAPQRVHSSTAIEIVTPGAANEDVITVTAEQRVVARCADEHIVAAAAMNHVVSAETADHIGPRRARQHVIAVGAQNRAPRSAHRDGHLRGRAGVERVADLIGERVHTAAVTGHIANNHLAAAGHDDVRRAERRRGS